MSVFDQRGQTVTYQTNTANIGAANDVSDRESLLAALHGLTDEVAEAYMKKALSPSTSMDAKQSLELATAEASFAQPDKNKLSTLLNTAKDAVKDVVAVAGLYEALTKLAEKVPHLTL